MLSHVTLEKGSQVLAGTVRINRKESASRHVYFTAICNSLQTKVTSKEYIILLLIWDIILFLLKSTEAFP